MKLKWRFVTEYDGEDAYVIERKNYEPGFLRWGPMPVEKVDDFIAQRRAELSATCDAVAKELAALSQTGGER